MKHRTADLTGARLDLAVALAEGYEWRPSFHGVATWDGRIVYRGRSRRFHGQLLVSPMLDLVGERHEMRRGDESVVGHWPVPWKPSTDRRIGGPILERAGIADDGSPESLADGLRSYVAGKLGPEIDLPDGL